MIQPIIRVNIIRQFRFLRTRLFSTVTLVRRSKGKIKKMKNKTGIK
jgi:hypothetical protein